MRPQQIHTSPLSWNFLIENSFTLPFAPVFQVIILFLAFTMSDTQAELEQLFTLVQSTSEPASDLSDVITHPSSADYGSKTSVWNAHCQQAPAIVIEAQDLPQLQAVTKYLYESSLHFAIKNGGVGSTSARDVLLILSNFKELEFSAESETLSVGGGALWSDVDSYMAREAPGWAGQ